MKSNIRTRPFINSIFSAKKKTEEMEDIALIADETEVVDDVKIETEQLDLDEEEIEPETNPIDVPSPKTVKRRKRRKPNLSKVLTCDQCSYTTNQQYLLNLHMYRHTTEKTIKCDECDKMVKNMVHLRAHIRNVHTVKVNVTCTICNRAFRSPYNLTNHMATVHPETQPDGKSYECHICHKEFIAVASLKRHVYSHSRAGTFLCNLCGASKRSEKDLERHMLRVDHNLDGKLIKPHVCSYCQKRFATKNELIIHTPVHTGEKNFQCPECGKYFANRNNLFQHKLTHMEGRHKCMFCDHKSRSKGNLRKHMAVHLNAAA